MFPFARSIGLGLALLLSACATLPPRTPYTVSDLAGATVIAGEPVRFWATDDDARYAQWVARMRAQQMASSTMATHSLLAISGGSDKGAFSAGLLNAWSKRGDRPMFDIVTGVSTGSLIAPFAFLGADQDVALTTIYTNIGRKDIYRERLLSGVFGGPSILDTRPLQALIARYITPAFVDRIAVEHRRGRRLLVMTTDLDAQRGVIWDMGAIAASGSPQRVALFRQILLASASIPGAFPPVLIDAAANGRHFSEMHVDGGTVSGFFVLPRPMLAMSAADVGGRGAIYVLYNGRLAPEFEVVKPRTFGILSRALSTVLGELDRNGVADLQAYARKNRVAVALCAIAEKPEVAAPLFDTAHMRSLYALGEASAARGCLAAAIPPGE